MDPILILQHDAMVPPGWLGDVLDEEGCPTAIVPLHEGGTVPRVAGWSGMVSLGGTMGAYDEDQYPFLTEEKILMREAVAAGVPVLGLCLGCQMLADALGGRAYLAPRPEVSFTTVTPTGAGAADPVVAALDGEVIVWHQDTWDLPPGATLLASTDRYPQAFRLGSAVGLQPHPEATPEIAAMWAATEAGRTAAERAGTDLDVLVADVNEARGVSEAMARRVFTSWLGEVRSGTAANT